MPPPGKTLEQFTVNGEPVSLDENGQATFAPTEPGGYVVTVIATDLLGKTTEVTADFLVLATGDTAPPVVEIASPEADAEISTNTNGLIIGIFSFSFCINIFNIFISLQIT